jgi:4-hydroxybenzoate polyprenyltransferase
VLPAILRLLRPKQWAKNLLVFAAALFTADLSRPSFQQALIAFAAMCLVSSATYVLNDALDAPRDRLHDRKKHRPIASGQVPVGLAAILGILLAAGAATLGWMLGPPSLAVLGTYAGLQVLYNVYVKQVPIADVFLIAIGFMLRAVLGATAIRVPMSGWFLFCTCALALMLGFSKRRDELMRYGPDSQARASLSGYSQQVLDILVTVFAVASMLSYGIYSIESRTAMAHPALAITTLFVWYGVCRYLYLVFHRKAGEEPEAILFSDGHIFISVALFVLFVWLAVSNLLQVNLIS